MKRTKIVSWRPEGNSFWPRRQIEKVITYLESLAWFDKLVQQGANIHLRATRKKVNPQWYLDISVPYYEGDYKGIRIEVKMAIEVRWCESQQSAKVRYYGPNRQNHPMGFIQKSSVYIEQVGKLVRTLIEEADNSCDINIRERKTIIDKKEEAKTFSQQLTESIGVPITTSSAALWDDRLAYGHTKAYRLEFVKVPDADLFNIKSITGDYSAEEIKQIIEIIGSSPRAIAARLIQSH